MGLLYFASNIEETSDRHSNEHLRTHYYKTRYNDLKQIVIAYAKANKMTIKSEDDKHGEIFLQASRFHIIVSIIQITPLETSVDLKVQTYKLLGLFKPLKIIAALYNHLNSKTQFKGVGLHP